MANYVLLSRLNGEGIRALDNDGERWREMRERLAQWEVKVVHEFALLGEYDHCLIFECPDNFKAYRAMLEEDLVDVGQSELMPAVDFPLFRRLISQSTATAGPHPWQTRSWAKLVRQAMYWHTYGRWAHRYCKPLHVTGKEVFDRIDGPFIVAPNHTSHMDAPVMMAALPLHVRWNIYSGAAADRWFLKDQKRLTLKPWYMSLVNGSFPIQRGGGSKTLEYAMWLLDHGANVILFPEGTRSGSRKLGRFRHGVSILALEKGVPVIPLYMTGLAAMRPKGSKVIRPGPAGAHFLEPVYFEPGTPIPDATRILFDRMNAVHRRVMVYGPEGGYLSDAELEAKYGPPEEARRRRHAA